MKQILATLFVGFMIAGGSNLFAQSKPQTVVELDAIADKILQSSDEHRKALYTSIHRLERLENGLEQTRSNSGQLKKDLKILSELMLKAQETGSVVVEGKEISTDRLRAWAKDKTDAFKVADQKISSSTKIVQDCKNAISEFEKAQTEAVKMAKEFKATMESYRRKLSLQLVQLQFTKSKLDSQFKFAHKMNSKDPAQIFSDQKPPTTPTAVVDFGSTKTSPTLAIELEEIAKELETAGNVQQAEKIRMLLNGNSK